MNGTVEFLNLAKVNAPYQAALEEAALRVVRSGRYVGGPENEAFERALAAAVGTAHAVGVSSGLDALRLVLRAWIELGRLRPGDEVVVPANTYIASILAVVDAGLVPVAVEPDERTMNLDTARLDEALTGRTRAVMPVHLYGRPCWDDRLREWAQRHRLLVIEDNAQAIGARAATPGLNGGHATGALGHAAAFSFYPTKNIGALGDAGAVTTDDAELARAVRALSNYGSDRRYHNIMAGYNCRLDPVQAACIAVKLPSLDAVSRRRRQLAAMYGSGISHPALTLPEAVEGHVWHQYVVRVGDGRRDRLRELLAERGVMTDVHYATPPHRQPCMGGWRVGPLPVTERLAAEVVSLPISEATTDEEARRVIDTINNLPPTL